MDLDSFYGTGNGTKACVSMCKGLYTDIPHTPLKYHLLHAYHREGIIQFCCLPNLFDVYEVS